MPTYFQRPENALKRANEFIDVGKHPRALDALYDVIKSKKHRTWQKIHEPIMEKYLELCVELKRSHTAKEGLYQYKNICQQVNIKSLEDVVRKYLALAEKKTEAARQESHQAVVDVDDLDIIQSPESLLLSAVSGEDTQDRTDRAILTPWVKFLWESYRQCLDLLRNNSSVEKLYQDIAQQAFKFCLKYARKTEFRKLCDNLRTHLGHIHKHQHQQRAINLNNPESQAMHLETRLVQLDSAIQMELWQEAFKAVEDIHDLIAMSKKPPKPSLMANYYQKLGLVFWKAGNYMFHACAWHRLFHLTRDQRKNLSQEELHRMASRVLCATLAIPIPPSRNQVDQAMDFDEATNEKQRRLAALLGLSSPPSRHSLVKDLIKYNVIHFVHPELQKLYQWLEVEFHPLKLYSRVKSSLEFIESKNNLSCYVPALQDITIMRLLKQVSQVYERIEFARIMALAPFASNFHLERVVVNAAKSLELQVRIDHRTQSLNFGTDLGVAQKEDYPEGPYLQAMPSEQIRNQMTHMARALEKAVNLIQPVKRDESELRNHIIANYRNTARKEHVRILQRRQIIEERKEELENISTQREREEVELREEERRKQYEAEMKRLEREAAEREKQRYLEEQEKIKRAHAKERLEQLRQTSLGAKVFAEMDEEYLAELDADEIMAKQVEQLEKEKKELQDRLKGQEKKIDHFVRAKRLAEIPLLQKKYEEEKVKMKEFWEIEEKDRIELLKKEREVALEHRHRLSRMMEDKEEYVNKLRDSRMSVYKEKLKDFEKKYSEERVKRILERKEKRKEERRQKWLKEKEEAEQKKHDEELKRQREEKEREEIEAREREEQEYQDRMRKLDEMAEKQRQREREIEEREQKRREELAKEKKDEEEPPKTRDTGAWRPRVSEGGWREREKERERSWLPRGGKDRESSPPRSRVETSPAKDDWRGAREDRDTPRAGGAWRRGGDEEREERGGAWRRGGDEDREERGSAWRRGGDDREERGGGWRRGGDEDREERGGGWRRGGDEDREERGGGWRRGGDEDREERGGGWRRGGDDAPRSGGWRDRERERDEERGGGGGWRDRAPAARGGDSWRDRESGRGGGGRDDRDAWRGRGDRDMGSRDFGRREDRDMGPRRDDRGFGRRDDRDMDSRRDDPDTGPRRDDRDMGPRRDDDRWGGDDRRPPPREGGGSSWRDREREREGGSGGGGGAWRRGGEERDRGGDAWRSRGGEEKRGGDDTDTWRRGGDSKPREERAGDDGWTTVRR